MKKAKGGITVFLEFIGFIISLPFIPIIVIGKGFVNSIVSIIEK